MVPVSLVFKDSGHEFNLARNAKRDRHCVFAVWRRGNCAGGRRAEPGPRFGCRELGRLLWRRPVFLRERHPQSHAAIIIPSSEEAHASSSSQPRAGRCRRSSTAGARSGCLPAAHLHRRERMEFAVSGRSGHRHQLLTRRSFRQIVERDRKPTNEKLQPSGWVEPRT
jgi:hypothetical protein